MSELSHFNCLEIGDIVRLIVNKNGRIGERKYKIVAKHRGGFRITIRPIGKRSMGRETDIFDLTRHVDHLKLVPDAKRTAAAMNASGAFRPFTVVGK